jgi:hypothetical protein
MYRHVLVKLVNTKRHEDHFSGFTIAASGQTEIATVRDASRQLSGAIDDFNEMP